MKKLFIIKIGGNVLDNEDSLATFLSDFASIQEPKILIHGGGKIATKTGDQLGVKSTYHEGRRITDAATRDLVTMVYGGLINKQLTARLQALNCNAIGLTGADGNLIKAVKRPVGRINYGYVGDVKAEDINTSFLNFLLQQGTVPVLAPLTHAQGDMLNTNADTIASVIAIALSSYFHVRLIFCFEKEGVMRDVNDPKSVIQNLNSELYQRLLKEGSFHEGILPKLENAFSAIRAGVHEVLIGEHSNLIANTGSETKGTLITT